jgi:hypothetical protein
MAKKKPPEDPVVVKIELPLPMDIAGTLIDIIGKTWPHTMITDDEHRYPSERRLALQIDERDRHKSAKAKAKYQKIKQYADGWVNDLCELGPNGVSVSPHEILMKLWADLARKTFDMFPDAPNYIESTVFDPETRARYVIYAAKSDRQTPHELRKKAEAEVERLKAQVAELEERLNADE